MTHRRAYSKIIIIAGLVVAICALMLSGFYKVKSQGLASSEYAAHLGNATVTFDEWGIPLITAPDWTSIARAQGFVLASERMWQMDLMRRKASGRLSEWFGAKALEHDRRVRGEGRLEVIAKSVEMLPGSQREFCEAYAEGINQFIRAFPGRWGIEYFMSRQTPEPWQCADTLLVILSMADILASASRDEWIQQKWRKVLPDEWENFLYTKDHPWNRPFFNSREQGQLTLPPASKSLPARELTQAELASNVDLVASHTAIGSNSWAWKGNSGAFLANDPHLGQSTPQLWYASRLKVGPDDWAVGVSLPGLPGIIIGMNPHIAWAFTNVGEDVDDLLEEKLDVSGTRYLAAIKNGQEIWREISISADSIKVKGASSVPVEIRRTHRGPLLELPAGSGKFYSRQWLGLVPGRLGLPSRELATVRDWTTFNAAIDHFTLPAQNIVMMDRKGNIGYRASGTGVIRRVDGRIPQPALEGEWVGLAPPVERHRMWIEAEAGKVSSMTTANQRMWVDRYGHNWSGEDRQERIVSLLDSSNAHTHDSMLSIQLDVTSRFRRELLQWIAKHGVAGAGREAELKAKWVVWDGSGISDPVAFGNSVLAEKLMFQILVGRVRDAFRPDLSAGERYDWDLDRGWLIALMTKPGSFALFGLEEPALATALIQKIAATEEAPLPERNAWNGQHPFVAGVPVAGWFFRTRSYPQYGYSDLVRAEKPDHGPSVRLLWNLAYPGESTWMFPVGQSGHLGSPHYADLQKKWANGEMMKALPAGF
jgi:penicillin amidase